MMKKKLLILLSFLLIIISVGCNKDDSIDNSTDVSNTQCYTIRINGTDENGIVSGSVINKPDESIFLGYGYIGIQFDKSDLLGQTVDSGDEINVKILSFKKILPEGHTHSGINLYYCKIHLCK